MPLLLHHHPILCFSPNHKPKPPKPKPKPEPELETHSQTPPLLRFRTSHRQNLTHLKNLGLIPLNSHNNLDSIISAVHFLKSNGFQDSDFTRLNSLNLDRDLGPVFAFLYDELSASPQQARGLILRCPALLTAKPAHNLRPTLQYLNKLGIGNLRVPTNLNAHLLNTRLEKLESKIEFLVSWGVGREDAGKMCARCPAIFGYSVENNLRPKVEFLVYEMGRGVEEVRGFPQFFAFSLERRMRPRHLWLKERGVRVSLRGMLFMGDDKFYAKWK